MSPADSPRFGNEPKGSDRWGSLVEATSGWVKLQKFVYVQPEIWGKFLKEISTEISIGGETSNHVFLMFTPLSLRGRFIQFDEHIFEMG